MPRAQAMKMSGAGNDFLVLGSEEDLRRARDPEWIRRVCRRGLSVGSDGVVLVAPVRSDRVRVEFRNPDGSEAFCGNGTRCAARFAHLQGWAGSAMLLETAVGEVRAEVVGEKIRLTLPPPRDLGELRLELRGRRSIPDRAVGSAGGRDARRDERRTPGVLDQGATKQIIRRRPDGDGSEYSDGLLGAEILTGRWIDAGVPHFVVGTDGVDDAPLQRWGPIVRRHPRFGAEGVNLDLAEFGPAGRIRLRTWERGVEGETLACGSGAVAAAYAARLLGHEETTTVVPASGIAIEVRLPGPRLRTSAAVVTGDARVIFEGRLGEEATRGFEVP